MDNGFLSGIGAGLLSGVESYGAARDRKLREQQALDQKELNRKTLLAQLAKSGLKEDQAGGLVRDASLMDPNDVIQMENRRLENQKLKNELDPASAANQLKQNEKSLDLDYKKSQIAKNNAEIDANKFKKTPAGLLQGLSGEQKGRLDNIVGAMNAVRDMDSALGKGTSTVSVIGDNDFTLSRNTFKEMIGRLQSGGAIGTQEAKDFMQLAPGTLDNESIRRQKLSKLNQLLSQRFKTFGFDENFLNQAGITITPVSEDGLLSKQEKKVANSTTRPNENSGLLTTADITAEQAAAELERRKSAQQKAR